jgi:hypothetical protein
MSVAFLHIVKSNYPHIENQSNTGAKNNPVENVDIDLMPGNAELKLIPIFSSGAVATQNLRSNWFCAAFFGSFWAGQKRIRY